MNEGAEGAEVGAEGSVDGELEGEVEEGEDDAIVVDDGEGHAALQPATRPSATTPTATRLMRPSRDLLQQDSIGYIELPPVQWSKGARLLNSPIWRRLARWLGDPA